MIDLGRDLMGQSNPHPRAGSRWVLNVSREGDYTTSLGSLLQCSVTLNNILRNNSYFLLCTKIIISEERTNAAKFKLDLPQFS